MAQQAQNDKPRIFISHAWEDKPLVRRLEAELQAAGAEVWIDHVGIRGGDNLPERISKALEWCNTLLLIWSEAASRSRWVKLEWANAISLEKAIIPCQLAEIKLPAILAHKAYVDFRNIDHGIAQLLQALNLAQQKTPLALTKLTQVARVIHSQLTESSALTKPKPPQILLRTKPLDNISSCFDDAAVQKMLKEKDFYDRIWNASGKGLRHEYEALERQGPKLAIDHTSGLVLQQSGLPNSINYADAEKYNLELNDKRLVSYHDWRLPTYESEAFERQGPKLVIDHTTGLMWQRSGSSESITYTESEKYFHDLNNERFAGYDDWRLPTLEEAMSLMDPQKYGELYLAPIFHRTQRWIWTADKESMSRAWYVDFSDGHCVQDGIGNHYFVRAVRS